MNSKRVYIIMVATIVLLIGSIVFGAYSTQKILGVKSGELVNLKAKLIAYKQQQTGLVQAKKDIATYTELYNIAKVVVPENKNQAETVRQIVKLAGANSIKLGSISFPSSTLGTMTPGAAAAKSTASLTQPTKSVAISGPDLSQLTPVVGSVGVYVLQITVASDSSQPATYAQLINFLSDLEHNRLTAEVTSVNIIPDSNVANRFTFTLSLNSYIKP